MTPEQEHTLARFAAVHHPGHALATPRCGPLVGTVAPNGDPITTCPCGGRLRLYVNQPPEHGQPLAPDGTVDVRALLDEWDHDANLGAGKPRTNS